MAAEAAESLLKECKHIIEKYQAKSMIEKKLCYRFLLIMLLLIVVDLQSWEKKIAEEKEQEYDNEEDVEIEEKITVSNNK